MRGRTYRRRVDRQLNTAQLPARVFSLGDLLKEKRGQGGEGEGRGRRGSIFTLSTAERSGESKKSINQSIWVKTRRGGEEEGQRAAAMESRLRGERVEDLRWSTALQRGQPYL